MSDKESARHEIGISVPATALLKSSEVATLLSVSRTTLSRWTKGGLISCVRLGPNMVYYEPREIQEFLKRYRKKYLPNTNHMA